MYRNWASGQGLAVLAVVLLLTACAADNYAAPVTRFADATAAAETALVNLNETTTRQYTEFLSSRARTDRGLAVLAGNRECLNDSQRCRIMLVRASGSEPPVQYPPDPLLGNMVAIMGEIRRYAQNLAAVIADKSADEAKGSINAALASVQSLANTVAAAEHKGKTSVPAFATPAGAGVNWLVGQYANAVKLDGLRTATEAADPVIQRAAALFASGAGISADVLRPDLAREFQTRLDAFQDDRADASKLAAAVEAARTYDGLLQAQPDKTFAKMAEAHAALTAALQGDGVSLPQAIAAVQGFAAQAEQLAAIARNLAAVVAKK